MISLQDKLKIWNELENIFYDNDSQFPDWFLNQLDKVKEQLFCFDGNHYITSDICCRPEHRYCIFCEQLQPNAELTPWEKE